MSTVGRTFIILVVLSLTAEIAAAQQNPSSRCVAPMSHDAAGFTSLPSGDLFCPLVADPKQPHSFASYVRETSRSFDTDVGAVGIGEHFGLFRWGAAQLSVSAGIFAQFDLLTPSYDLINADYLIGLPLSIRHGRASARLRIYHQSSHLGDELLLRNPDSEIERENLSFESLELILSQELGPLRVYGGGELLFNREPEELEQKLIHGGVELYPSAALIRVGQLGQAGIVAAVDAKLPAEQEWTTALSVRAGLEVGRSRELSVPSRRWRLLAEYYTGPSPYGQFFDNDVTYYGIGLHLTL